MKFNNLILGLSATMLLASCSGGNPNITEEQWDKAFDEVLENFTYKAVINNTVRGFLEFNETGFHEASYDDTGAVYKEKEEYIEWTTDKTYSYSYNTTNEHWTKTETTANYDTKEYQVNYNKVEITFIGRFSDFKYNSKKGGYFASTSKTSEVNSNGENDGGFEVNNVLVKFKNTKITSITFSVTGAFNDGKTVVDYSVSSIGSTTFAFPTVLQ